MNGDAKKMNWYRFATRHSVGQYSNLKLLGCGENGCAYLDEATGHVVKETISKVEADRAEEIRKNPLLTKRTPKVYKVTPNNGKFLIERENIESLPQAEADFMDEVQFILEEVDYNIEKFTEVSKEEFYDDDKIAIKVAEELIALRNWVKKLGWGENDVRGDNIGIRGNTLIIRDLDL